MNYEDKVAIVAGASQGLGLGVAEALAGKGAQVIIWSNNEEKLQKAVAGLAEKGLTATYMKVDVTDYDQVQLAVDKVVEENGKLDIMVASVGGGNFGPFVGYTPEFWHQQINYNLSTVFNCFHVALKPMLAQSFGRLLCFMSTTGGTPMLAAYGASKGAVKGMMETIAVEHEKDHVTANAIMPGLVLTPKSMMAFSGPGGEERLQQTLSRMPLGANTVENVARTALNVLEDDRLTGQVINLH